MSKSNADQLGLFESTNLGWGIDLGIGGAPGAGRYREVSDEAEQAVAAALPAVSRPPSVTYRLIGDRPLAKGWKARAADNIAAIRLAHQIEDEGRPATADEQDVLAKWVGFGATDLANSFFRREGEGFRSGWEDLGADLEQLLSPADMAALARSTQYAHFTPEYIVRALWRAVRAMGFSGGTILEPGCGSGLFLALMPEKVAQKSAVTAIEMEPSTARIARLLYPDAWVRQEDFTKAKLTETYDLVIGNPPFSDRTVRAEDPAGQLGLSLHEYFMARSIARLKPGGLAAFVCSRFAMDRSDPKARRHIAEMADFLGAIRMPQGSMMASSGTEVVVDLLFFQRRAPGQTAAAAAWDELAEVMPPKDGEGSLQANRYFADHPEMVLGTHGWTTSPFGPVYTCRHRDDDLDRALEAAVDRLPRDIHQAAAIASDVKPGDRSRLVVGTAADGATIKEGSYVVVKNTLMQVINGTPEVVAIKAGRAPGGIFPKRAKIIRQMIPVRDAVREVLRAQMENRPWGPAQMRLRVAYGAFVRAFGPINHTVTTQKTDPETGAVSETLRRPNLAPFADDPDCWLVASIEEYDPEHDTARKGPIFTERVLLPPADPVITSADDALAVSLAERGCVDIAHIAELLARSQDETVAELGEAVYLDPEQATGYGRGWQTADAYLSGPVRSKLVAAESAAAEDPRFTRNVDALRRVQPKDLAPSDITARLGAPWIPTAVVEQFAAEVIGIKTTIRHTVEVASWSVDKRAFAGQAAATSEWGTARRHVGELLDDALHATIPVIWDTWHDENGEHREVNTTETEAAKEKLVKLKTAFTSWIWTDPERTDRLCRAYNDAYNNIAPRQFDGSHLKLPGVSAAIQFYQHQKRVIWRIIAAGSTYVAHAVGAGKTFSMVAAIMEQKRLGLISKSMMAVPGHCLAQASREFLQLYPTARILVADETNFIKEKRARFLARAATSQWDCIIITHSAFELIAAPAAFEQGMIQQQLQSYSELLERIDGDDRITRKRIENKKEKLEAKLQTLASRKDDMLTLAEIGVDQLVIDEAHEYRRLSFTTQMTNLKGVQPDGSQQAWDLFVKSRFVETINPGRSLIMASGTPIVNTLAEMFTVQRFMQPDELERLGLHEFDPWASNFGDQRTELELQPSGMYKPVTRFNEFVNTADLMAMFRSIADVILKTDLREILKLPQLIGGERQIITAQPTAAFKWYQRYLGRRIKAIEERRRRPQKGDDILLSVITDGRHAAMDLRFVLDGYVNEEGNKLNLLINSVFNIWRDNRENVYLQPDGTPYPIKGAAQMIFSDLGTEAAQGKRGFSAYTWIRDSLIARGVPAEQIAFMQNFKKTSEKQRLFADLRAGRVTVLIGSSQNMGTGVNAQTRLIAIHHLDVPWYPALIEQREGRGERQGNQNRLIGIYAYVTGSSTDATMWQLNEQKQRMVNAAMAGDRSVRRIVDTDAQVNQLAMAKAIASGDPRLMRRAGLEADFARLQRQEAAFFDDQHAVRSQLVSAQHLVAAAERRIADIEQDVATRQPTRGDSFSMEVEGVPFDERTKAGAAILSVVRRHIRHRKQAEWEVGRVGGFDISVACVRGWRAQEMEMCILMHRNGMDTVIPCPDELTALGLVSRLEHALAHFDAELAEQCRILSENRRRIEDYEPRLAAGFGLGAELATKIQELAELDADLAASAETLDSSEGDTGGYVLRVRSSDLHIEVTEENTVDA